MPSQRVPWNKGKLVGQKAPLKLSDIWSIRVRLQLSESARDLALFNLAIDSKLRGCDLVSLRLRDVSHGTAIAKRAVVLQRKTGRPVQFELTDQTRASIAEWARQAQLTSGSICFRVDQGWPPTSRLGSTRGLSPSGLPTSGSNATRMERTACAGQGLAHLSAHQEPAGCPDPARAHQAGKHGEISRNRG